MISKSHCLEESTPQRRTEVVTGSFDKRCFSFYLFIRLSYYSPHGLRGDSGDTVVRGPSFVSVTYKVYGCHHIPVNKRWMSHIGQLVVRTHRQLTFISCNVYVHWSFQGCYFSWFVHHLAQRFSGRHQQQFVHLDNKTVSWCGGLKAMS